MMKKKYCLLLHTYTKVLIHEEVESTSIPHIYIFFLNSSLACMTGII